MTKENVKIIEAALNEAINKYNHCAEVGASEGNKESELLFIIAARDIKKALNEFLEENKK